MFISRINQNVIFQSIEGKFVTTVLGSRRVGKSFLIKEYMKRHSDRIWVTLNMGSLAEREIDTMKKSVSAFCRGGQYKLTK